MFFKNQSMGSKFRIFGFSGQTLVLKGSKFVFSKLRSQSSTSGRSLVFVSKPGFDKASKFVIFLFVLHFVQLYVFTSSTKSLYDLDTYVDGVRLFCFYCVFFFKSIPQVNLWQCLPHFRNNCRDVRESQSDKVNSF